MRRCHRADGDDRDTSQRSPHVALLGTDRSSLRLEISEVKPRAGSATSEQAKICNVDPELVGLLSEAQNDPEAVALVLFGSAASGSTHEGSDLDVWYVRRSEPLPPRERRGRLEIVPTTLDLLRAAPDWLKPAVAYAQTVWDETGEVESVLAAARTISHDETAELYDGYLNDFYRSLKAWRVGNELAGRIADARCATWASSSSHSRASERRIRRSGQASSASWSP